MQRRTLTTIIGVALLVLVLAWADASVVLGTLFAAFITGWAVLEYNQLFLRNLKGWRVVLLAVSVLFILLIPFAQGRDGAAVSLFVAGYLILAAGGTYANRRDQSDYISGFARAVLGYFYIALPMGLMVLLLKRHGEGGDGRALIAFLLSVTFFNDIGALLIGRKYGRLGPKLAPWLSPNKTVIGALGGLAFAVAGMTVMALLGNKIARLWNDSGLFWLSVDLRSWGILAVLAVFIAAVAQVGDLVESALKRSVGAKDSGNDFTGHGGVLDIIDALLFTSPALYLVATIWEI